MKQKEIKTWISRNPCFEEMLCGVNSAAAQPKAVIKDTKKAVALARKFNAEVVRPLALELEVKASEDPEYLPWEFVEKANSWGFYSLWIPKAFGGKGLSLSSLSVFMEEVASACTGMANLIGVHYLGIATLISGWNSRLIMKICGEVVEGEKNGRPCLISLALTEPDAGTDIEETDLMDKGVITCSARKVDGGYLVNGTKVFISNGHLSTWHILFSFTNTKKPSENLALLAVKTGTPGFSFGRMEKKMGQKACPASELVFRDAFIEDENVCIDPSQTSKLGRSHTSTTMQIIDYIFSASRAGVCAFGTGVARGAYEEALRFASETKVQGRYLVDHEWAQGILAEMYRNVEAGRLSYIESNYANSIEGIYRYLYLKPVFYITRFTPPYIMKKIVYPYMHKKMATWLIRKLHMDLQTDREIERTSGLASLAKFTGTDMGMKNCHLALELMGSAGIRHDQRAEKHFRDAKLLQIYEGTNQLNRINLFKCLIAPTLTDVKVFGEQEGKTA